MTYEEICLEIKKKEKEYKDLEKKYTDYRKRYLAYEDGTNYAELSQLGSECGKKSLEIDSLKQVDVLMKERGESTSSFFEAYKGLAKVSKGLVLEDDPEVSKKIEFLKKHYREDEQFAVQFDYFPTTLRAYKNEEDDFEKRLLEEDLKRILSYFDKKEEKNIYKWEIRYVTFLFFHDHYCHTSYASKILGDLKQLEKTKECEEYVNNCDKLIESLDNKAFSFNLLLWTIFKTYRYLYDRNTEFIFNKADLALIDRLTALAVKLVKTKIVLKENGEEEPYFISEMPLFLCLDLMHTINNEFPDYYEFYGPYIMFFAHGFCDNNSAIANMESFDTFIDSITEYDFWFDEIDGHQEFEKSGIERDYKKVLKENGLI